MARVWPEGGVRELVSEARERGAREARERRERGAREARERRERGAREARATQSQDRLSGLGGGGGAHRAHA